MAYTVPIPTLHFQYHQDCPYSFQALNLCKSPSGHTLWFHGSSINSKELWLTHGNVLSVSYPHLVTSSLMMGHLFPPFSASWPPLKGESHGRGWRRWPNATTKNYPDHDTAFGSTCLLVPHPQNLCNAICLASKEERTRRKGRWMEERREIPQTTHTKTHTDRKGRNKDNCRGIFWIFFPWLINKINEEYCYVHEHEKAPKSEHICALTELCFLSMWIATDLIHHHPLIYFLITDSNARCFNRKCKKFHRRQMQNNLLS